MEEATPEQATELAVSVDFAYTEDSFEVALAHLRDAYPELTVEVKQESGPGGGWPELRLRGTADVLVHALKQSWELTDAELWELYRLPTERNRAIVQRTTTDKLEAVLNAMAGDWSTVTPTYQGGRDWVVVAQR